MSDENTTQDIEQGANTHYDVEDVPDMSDADTVLDMWRESRKASPTLAEAQDLVNGVQAQLSHVYQWAVETGKKKLATDLQHTWERVSHLHHQLKTHESVAGAAGQALDAVDTHRQAVLTELESIMSALRDEGEHPLVSDFSDMVVEEEFEGLYENASVMAESENREYMTGNFAYMFKKLGMVQVDAWSAAEELVSLGMGRRMEPALLDGITAMGEALLEHRNRTESGYRVDDEGVA